MQNIDVNISCSVIGSLLIAIFVLLLVLFHCKGQGGDVFVAQDVDFMKDVISDG